jgi:hypothetical protein
MRDGIAAVVNSYPDVFTSATRTCSRQLSRRVRVKHFINKPGAPKRTQAAAIAVCGIIRF